MTNSQHESFGDVSFQVQKARAGCAHCGVYYTIEMTDNDADPEAQIRYCPNCRSELDLLEVYND